MKQFVVQWDERLDRALAEGSGYSRSFARELIESSAVTVDGKIVQKPGFRVRKRNVIGFQPPKTRYVSRGGYKLEKAITLFQIDVYGKICLDVGASTGGFTDCLLQFGARKVYAVDTGSNQLAEVLSQHEKVISYERMNILTFTKAHLTDTTDEMGLIVADVSFVSIGKVLPKLIELLASQGQMVILVKPQFEAGRNFLNKKGIVKDRKVHRNVLMKIYEQIIEWNAFAQDVTPSPIAGGDGNVEYLLLLNKMGAGLSREVFCRRIQKIVEEVEI